MSSQNNGCRCKYSAFHYKCNCSKKSRNRQPDPGINLAAANLNNDEPYKYITELRKGKIGNINFGQVSSSNLTGTGTSPVSIINRSGDLNKKMKALIASTTNTGKNTSKSPEAQRVINARTAARSPNISAALEAVLLNTKLKGKGIGDGTIGRLKQRARNARSSLGVKEILKKPIPWKSTSRKAGIPSQISTLPGTYIKKNKGKRGVTKTQSKPEVVAGDVGKKPFSEQEKKQKSTELLFGGAIRSKRKFRRKKRVSRKKRRRSRRR